MYLKKWEDLPADMQTPEVRPYYEALSARRGSLVCKRLFDVLMSLVLLVLLSPLMLAVSLAVALDSRGGVFYRQVRVTSWGKEFRIHKFRTMVARADQMGAQVTVGEDRRITRVGKLLRGCRLDELPQLLDVLAGNMSFVGTRPEVPLYVARYTPEMRSTLLLPAGITSEASIRYKDEAKLLELSDDVDRTYETMILPRKMRYNLRSIAQFSLGSELATLFRTVAAVLGRDYPDTLNGAEETKTSENRPS